MPKTFANHTALAVVQKNCNFFKRKAWPKIFWWHSRSRSETRNFYRMFFLHLL